MRANWKLLVENSYDGYHAMTTHQRYLEMLKDSGKDLSRRSPGAKGGPAARAMDLGNGHAVIGGADGSGGTNTGLGRGLSSDDDPGQAGRSTQRLVELYGEDWANRMFASRNLVIFPNLLIVDLIMGITSAPSTRERPTTWRSRRGACSRATTTELRDMRMRTS